MIEEAALQEKKGLTFVFIALYDNMALGLRYLSAVLKKEGHNCFIVFFKSDVLPDIEPMLYRPNSAEIESLVGLVKRLKPDIVGVNVSSTYLKIAIKITSALRDYANVPIVWGGPHPTVLPEEAIEFADMVCIGEGEEALKSIANNFIQGRGFNDIPNLWLRDSSGTVIKNSIAPLSQDLDIFPFPDYEPEDKYYVQAEGKVIHKAPEEAICDGDYNMISSRGCPFSCAYCDNSNLKRIYKDQKYLRRRSVENVIEEMKAAAEKLPVQNFVFLDDVFLFDEEWLTQFAKAYKRYINKPFFCRTHPQFTNEGILTELKKVGLKNVGMGIESGSRRMLRLYRRPSSPEQIIRAVKILHKLGFYSVFDIILDDPLATESDLRETLALLFRLPRPFFPKTFSLAHFPKAELTQRELSEKLISQENIEGMNEKFNWRVTPDSIVREEHQLLNCLIELTGNIFIPNLFIKLLAKSQFLKKNPNLLAHIVYPKRFAKFRRRIFEISRLSILEIIVKLFKRIVRLGRRGPS